ncbi:MAG TPA: hypothetical protein PKD72_14680, partial [Gemmatales bacterium]|nr:hypothetical protein [Gemmatales bacterium]
MRSQAEGWAELQPGERDYSLKVAQLHIDAAKEILDALAKEKSVEHRDRGWHAQFVEDRKKLERPLDKLVLTMNGLSPPKVLPITDEPYVTMKVGMQTSSTGTQRTGFPVLRLWSAGVDVAVSPITLEERFVA